MRHNWEWEWLSYTSVIIFSALIHSKTWYSVVLNLKKIFSFQVLRWCKPLLCGIYHCPVIYPKIFTVPPKKGTNSSVVQSKELRRFRRQNETILWFVHQNMGNRCRLCDTICFWLSSLHQCHNHEQQHCCFLLRLEWKGRLFINKTVITLCLCRFHIYISALCSPRLQWWAL